VLGRGLERRRVDPRHGPAGHEADLRDGAGIHRHLRRGLDRGGGRPRLLQHARELHREAAGVGGRDELLGIRAGGALEAGLEGVVAGEGAGLRGEPAVAGAEDAIPGGGGGAGRHRKFLGSVNGRTPHRAGRTVELYPAPGRRRLRRGGDGRHLGRVPDPQVPMIAPTWRTMLFLLLPATAACGRDGGPAFSVRDSSGVEIAESRRPDWPDDQPGLVLSVEPVVEVGAVEGAPEEQLDQVAGVVRLSDGRVAVANGATEEIRFYGPDGRFLLAAGRSGQGPGEFERLGGLWRLPGDTLAAYDGQLRRISLFGPAGGLLRSVMVPSPVAAEFPRVTGAFTDGT